MRRALIMLSVLVMPVGAANAAGLQWPVIATDPGGTPIEVAVWYPSPDKPAALTLMDRPMSVARDGAIGDGDAHQPLIVFSHGIYGSPFDHNDTAIALADAGFIVAAVAHTHDNSEDHSETFTASNIADRPRHVSRAIDMMLDTWKDRKAVDPERIGIFGFSAGSITAMLAVGGRADLGQMVPYCRKHSTDFICVEHIKHNQVGGDIIISGVEDSRIKAAVVAAPALSATFIPGGLSEVTVPIEMWVGGADQVTRGFDYAAARLSPQPDYHFVPDASHLSFIVPCTGFARLWGQWTHHGACKEVNSFDRAAFHLTFNASVVKFFKAHLESNFETADRR